ncbi:MAG TPA: hypothetical protein DEF51_33305 [Myxococcales bacterium]|nr:hypothetical protein [Myxococcales bacterium]
MLDDVELSMRAYKGAMHRLIDLGALEAQTLGGGCGITPFGVELSEDRQLLQQELPVSRTPYTSEGSDEPYPVSRRDLRRLLRGVMRLSQQVAEREQFDVEETTAWLQRVDASVPPLRAELNAPSEPLRRACDGQGATRAELLDGLSEIREVLHRALKCANHVPTLVGDAPYLRFLGALLDLESLEVAIGKGLMLRDLRRRARLTSEEAERAVSRLVDEGLGHVAHDELDEVLIGDEDRLRLRIHELEDEHERRMSMETTVELLKETRPPKDWRSIVTGLARKQGLSVDPHRAGQTLLVVVRWSESASAAQLSDASREALDRAAMAFANEAETALLTELEREPGPVPATTVNVSGGAVGAIGSISMSESEITAVGGNQASQSGADLGELADVLAELRELLVARAATADTDELVVMGRVAEAEKAAKSGSRRGVRKALASVGDKVLEIMVKAGADEMAEKLAGLLGDGS